MAEEVAWVLKSLWAGEQSYIYANRLRVKLFSSKKKPIDYYIFASLGFSRKTTSRIRWKRST